MARGSCKHCMKELPESKIQEDQMKNLEFVFENIKFLEE